MKLHSMKLTAKEQEKTQPASVLAEQPRYPWGLGLHLDDETLDKLGIGLPELGKTLLLQARVKVTGAMAQETEGSGKSRQAQLQITDMGIDVDEGEGGDAADKLYDGGSQ